MKHQKAKFPIEDDEMNYDRNIECRSAAPGKNLEAIVKFIGFSLLLSPHGRQEIFSARSSFLPWNVPRRSMVFHGEKSLERREN